MYSNKKRERMRRILALIMAVFLIISVCATLIYYLVTPLYAAEHIADTSGDDRIVTVGLMFANGVTIGFETKADGGFVVERIERSGDFSRIPIWELSESKVSCTVDHNLSKAVMTYSKTDSVENTVIGGWHTELGNRYTYDEFMALIDTVSPALSELELYPIPAYIGGSYKLRVGHFADEFSASVCAQTLTSLFPELTVSIVAPSASGVSVVNPDNDMILFEYDDNDITALGLSPKNTNAYLITPAKNQYFGSFMFRRNGSNYIDGTSVTNVLSLGDYTKCVVPCEISNTWPIECQKALAVGVRSFALYAGRHSTFDVCNDSSCCQTYRGIKNINDRVISAIDETAGLVLTYNGEGVSSYFSAVTGGCTVGNYEGFGGGQLPYLVAVDTPWEIYTNHSRGVWTKEVSPSALCSAVRKMNGFSHLRDAIASIDIKTPENSTYVSEITFTDIYGNTATKKNNVYYFLHTAGLYLSSSNFVVGKGSVVGKETTFDEEASVAPTPSNFLTALTKDGTASISPESYSNVLTASGLHTVAAEGVTAVTARGTVKAGEKTHGSTVSTTKDITIYADNPNNFIFYGKGWGHGVGASQVGMRDLANLGYDFDEILKKYFTGIEISDWRQAE